MKEFKSNYPECKMCGIENYVCLECEQFQKLKDKTMDDFFNFFNEISDDEPTRAELEMLESWGERCEDFDCACIVCRAWKHFDETGEIE